MSMRQVNGDAVLTGARGTGVHNSPAMTFGPGVADVLVAVHVTAASGTTPTLAVSVEQSVDGATWTAVAGSSIPGMTGIGNASCNAQITAAYARVTATIGGTTPSFTFRALALVFAE